MNFEILNEDNLEIAIQIQHEIFPLENGSEDIKETINNSLPKHQFLQKYWLAKVGNKYAYSGSLAQNESASFTIVCNATKAANITNVAIAGSNMTGNVSASADVSIIEEIIPTPTPTPVTLEDEKPVVQVPMDSKATGNPIIMLLLIIFALIPLRRRKE